MLLDDIQETIIGYQWGAHMQFIGAYEFPNNFDKEDIHLPPRTTLIEPPEVAKNEIAKWDGTQWIVTEDDVTIKNLLPPVDNYEMLLPAGRQAYIDNDQWTDEDQSKYEEAQAARIAAAEAKIQRDAAVAALRQQRYPDEV